MLKGPCGTLFFYYLKKTNQVFEDIKQLYVNIGAVENAIPD